MLRDYNKTSRGQLVVINLFSNYPMKQHAHTSKQDKVEEIVSSNLLKKLERTILPNFLCKCGPITNNSHGKLN